MLNNYNSLLVLYLKTRHNRCWQTMKTWYCPNVGKGNKIYSGMTGIRYQLCQVYWHDYGSQLHLGAGLTLGHYG